MPARKRQPFLSKISHFAKLFIYVNFSYCLSFQRLLPKGLVKINNQIFLNVPYYQIPLLNSTKPFSVFIQNPEFIKIKQI